MTRTNDTIPETQAVTQNNPIRENKQAAKATEDSSVMAPPKNTQQTPRTDTRDIMDLPARNDTLRELWWEQVGTMSEDELSILCNMAGIKYGRDDGSGKPINRRQHDDDQHSG